ncbi:MFS transporter [Streptomyces sp. NPDC019937]|uniref:MFS transporter n=1 Tax=Streptomyces sp. NPDC019937 TaxID=3154787 RepID=UPI00340FF4AD
MTKRHLPAVLAPLGRPGYRRLFAAMVLALFGYGAWTIYLALQALELGASAPELASVVVWTGVGLLATAFATGVVADRAAKRSVLLAVLVANLATTGVIAALSLADGLALWHLSVSAFAVGAATAFFFPAYTALVPVVVPASDLMAVNGLEGATRPSVQQAAAPAAVGALVGATVPAAGALLTVSVFAAALLCTLGLPPGAPEAETTRTHPVHDLVEGFRFAARTPWILASVVFAALMGLLVTGPLEVLLPALVRARSDNGSTVYGLLVAVLGLGGLAGSLVAGSLTMPRRYLTTMLGSWALGCLPISLVALTDDPWVIGASLFVYGALLSVGLVIWGTLLQRRVPMEMIGRIAGLDFLITIAFMPVSIAFVGLVSQQLSHRVLFLIAGLAPIVLAVLVGGLAKVRADETAHPLDDDTIQEEVTQP